MAFPQPSAAGVYALLGLITSLAFASLYLFEKFPELASTERSLFVFGGAIMGVLFIICVLGPRIIGSSDRRWATVFFLFTVWSANVDLYLTANLLGFTKIGSFYLELGEEYFKTPWGVGSLLWDGTTHYVCQAMIASYSLKRKECTLLKLFWCGSIINSMPVLLMGAAVGEYSDKIKPAMAFNYPYVIVPIAISFNAFTASTNSSANSKNKSKVRIYLLLETLFVASHIAMFAFHSLRCMSVLDSKANVATVWKLEYEPELNDGFAKPQIMQNFFVFSYWHIFAIYESLHRIFIGKESSIFGCNAHLWATFIAGCFCQGQFCYLLLLLFEWEPNGFTFRERKITDYALLCNAMMMVFPCIQALVWTAVVPRYSEKKDKQS